MNISTLTPIKQLPRPHEVSHLRSPRDSDAIYSAWKRENEIVKGYNQVIGILNQMTREIKRLEGRRTQDFDFFPFKIYNLPDEFQVNSFSSDNWRKVNIRGGYVFTQTFDTGSTFVNGTDRMEPVAYQNILSPPPYNAGQYTVPTGSAQYWFWVEKSGSFVSGSPYFLRYASNPLTPDSASNPNGWTNWPSASANNYVLGYADTSTQAPNNTMIFRQIQVGDIVTSPVNYITMSVCDTNTGQTMEWWISAYPFTGSGG